MEEQLRLVIEGYLDEVNRLCYQLLKGLNLKTKTDLWEYRRIYNEVQIVVEGVQYIFHGKGCRASNEKYFIDWDFGYGSRWCGVEPWLLARTLKQNKDNYTEYYDGNKIKEECEKAVLQGIMIKKYELYYFAIPISETFRPSFPNEFDVLIVEHFDSQWKIPRNKTVNRFLRKSNQVYQHIDKNPNRYTLRFILEGKEVYSIVYDDIGYPEKAVSLMNELLRMYSS